MARKSKKIKKPKAVRKKRRTRKKIPVDIKKFLSPSGRKLKLVIIILLFMWLLPGLFNGYISTPILRGECPIYSSIEESFDSVVTSCAGSFGKLFILDITFQLLMVYLLACLLVSWFK